MNRINCWFRFWRCAASYGEQCVLNRPVRPPSHPQSPWPISSLKNDKGIEMKESEKVVGGGGSRRNKQWMCVYAKYMCHQQKRS